MIIYFLRISLMNKPLLIDFKFELIIYLSVIPNNFYLLDLLFK